MTQKINIPQFQPETLMPQLDKHDLTVMSLFSGGGGLDLGFDRAGFQHVVSYELLPVCKETLNRNRLGWNICAGLEGDVTEAIWTQYENQIDVIQGGPPCQPFSIAGSQKGLGDKRNMWGEFQRAINTIKPRAFVAENVLGLLNPKFRGFVQKHILDKLQDYHIHQFVLHAVDFGVPQIRQRVFFVGFRSRTDYKNFQIPKPTHVRKSSSVFIFDEGLPETLKVRAALGLPDIGFDNFSPTIRSGFTGKRNTTSILNSSAGQKIWGDMGIWPNGVQADRVKASKFPAKNGHFRLSIQDVALLQGFPESWVFEGAVYQKLGQIGNSVVPPVAYEIARNVSNTLCGRSHKV